MSGSRIRAEVRRPLQGARACLTTRHGKLRAVAKPLRDLVGLDVYEEATIDTDALGTFSGEIERVGTPVQVVPPTGRALRPGHRG